MMRVAALIVVASACASSPRVTDALHDWRSGRRASAIAAARGEVERFRQGNEVAPADIEQRLAEVERVLGDETPILLPDPSPPAVPEDPMSPGASLDAGLRQDLASLGVTRTLRALRVVRRLGMSRFASDLFIVIWRREPFVADGPLMSGDPSALRSVAVKVAALRALESLL